MKTEQPPIIFDIVRGSFCDGPGIRTVVFMQGCPLTCAWCHNPESQACYRELSGTVRAYTVDELYEIIILDNHFYNESGGGVTFSGGEPLMHITYLCEIAKRLKEKNISIAYDTSGYFNYNDFGKELIKYTDLLLFDLKIIDPKLHYVLTGVDNAIIIENLGRASTSSLKIVIRVPLIPPFITAKENLLGITRLMKKNKLNGYELLTYNPSYIDKLIKLERTPNHNLSSNPMPIDEELRIRKEFEEYLVQ
ncbi:MAG: 4Fe-4S cluster-binding domain-containing protein [Spirochaetota bacterium]